MFTWFKQLFFKPEQAYQRIPIVNEQGQEIEDDFLIDIVNQASQQSAQSTKTARQQSSSCKLSRIGPLKETYMSRKYDPTAVYELIFQNGTGPCKARWDEQKDVWICQHPWAGRVEMPEDAILKIHNVYYAPQNLR